MLSVHAQSRSARHARHTLWAMWQAEHRHIKRLERRVAELNAKVAEVFARGPVGTPCHLSSATMCSPASRWTDVLMHAR